MAERICSVEGCERPAERPTSRRGWCGMHYQRWYKHGDPLFSRDRTPQRDRVCSIDGCQNPACHRGWCRPHYGAWQKRGDPHARVPRNTQVFTDTHKLCVECGETKPLEDFRPDRKSRSGRQGRCKPCRRKQVAAWRRTWTPEQIERARLKYRRRNLRESYGITPEDYDALLQSQAGRCICGTTKPGPRVRHFHVDHDHSDGHIRGLLCQDCNFAIGLAGDHPERLELLAAYLRRKAGPGAETERDTDRLPPR